MKIKKYLEQFMLVFIPLFSNISLAIEKNVSVKTKAIFAQKITHNVFAAVLTNGKLQLVMNANSGEFYILNAATNTRWYSNPVNRNSDKLANSLGKLMMDSQLIVTFYTQKNTVQESTSAAACVKKNGLSIYKEADAIRCEYSFVKEKVVIPVEYRLNKNGLEASVMTKDILENGTLKVATIALLPYFSAVATNEEGYLMVPDGCGSLLNLTSQVDNYGAFSYKKYVYGKDQMLSTKQVTTKNEEILIPAFGLKYSRQSAMGLITEGDAVSCI